MNPNDPTIPMTSAYKATTASLNQLEKQDTTNLVRKLTGTNDQPLNGQIEFLDGNQDTYYLLVRNGLIVDHGIV